jgi:hypothetical protein
MNPLDKTAGPASPLPNAAGPGDDAATGLPWLPTWRGLYWLVLGSFVLWVGLLFALSVVFS